MKHDENDLSKALKSAKRYHEKCLNDEFVDEEPSKKRFRESGGGRKCKAPEVKLDKQCSSGLLMYEEYWRDAYPSKCFDQSASKYTMNV